MKYLIASLLSFLTLWAASVFLGGHPNWRINDKKTGLQLPASGSYVARFTEGGGVSRYGDLGLNPVAATASNACKPLGLFFVLSLFLLAMIYPAGDASPFIYFHF